jgi:uncharacterized protein (TIGR01777 family)
MNILIPGGSGQVGQILKRYFIAHGYNVVILSRSSNDPSNHWDGKSLGSWVQHIDNANVVINLAGRTVNCRYTDENFRQMMDSRVDSTRVIGQAIQQSKTPPRLWLQMSTATIYAHRFDASNDESSGIIGGNEPDVPAYWSRSIDIAKAWETELDRANTPQTRKVALRTSMVMSPDSGGVFDVLRTLTGRWLGGSIAGGKQFVSWIHESDFNAAIKFLINRDDIDGPVNICAPNPLPQRVFQRELRSAMNVPIGLPATKWMAKIGAIFMRTDIELILKSRRVIPGRLLDAGFAFRYPNWPAAAVELVSRA